MTKSIYLPIDEMTEGLINYDLAADCLELSAFFADDSKALSSDLANQAEIGAEDDFVGLDEEMRYGAEEIVSGTVARIEKRQRVLGPVYPFELDGGGNVLEYVPSEAVGPASYILSLVLSHLRAMTPVLDRGDLHPDQNEVRKLREFFQYFATAALAAEIQGSAWSFGFPRPDGSGFLEKLDHIWRVLGDGRVGAQRGSPQHPKDDQVDVFAARTHLDRLPGFPLAAAQVATGKNAKHKSLKGHIGAFKTRWFEAQPVTEFIAYMIVPFAIDDEKFFDDVRTKGNILHRLRAPRRVAEAEQLLAKGTTIEGYDRLAEAVRWIEDYRRRMRTAA